LKYNLHSQRLMLTWWQWTAVAVVIAAIGIPILWIYWKRWDRPSRKAKAEMARRKEEHEVRVAFMQLEAESSRTDNELALMRMKLRRRKQEADTGVSEQELQRAYANIGEDSVPSVNSKDFTGNETISESVRRDDPHQREDSEYDLEKIPETIVVPDIEVDDSEEELLPLESGPIAVKVDLPAAAVASDEIERHLVQESTVVDADVAIPSVEEALSVDPHAGKPDSDFSARGDGIRWPEWDA
jgi:hypothetical protein